MPAGRSKEPIELNRRFRWFPDEGEEGEPEVVAASLRAVSDSETWDQLLGHRYVVVLGEAGTGKTVEFRMRAARLIQEGRAAFFIPIEALAAHGPEESLDPDGNRRLATWLTTDAPGYFFLDSVDEAKLRQHSISSALRRLTNGLGSAFPRAQILISSRASDWQPQGDRLAVERIIREALPPGDKRTWIHVAQIVPLNSDQISTYARHILGDEAPRFLRAVDESNAEELVERPQDLERLAEYWLEKGALGSLRDLVEFDIDHRLRERPDRRSALSPAKAREGLIALAGLATIRGSPSIALPEEGFEPGRSASALDPRSVLPDWSDLEIQQLLTLPVFDEATYGCVRVHHRSVQEFLAAKWLAELLDAGLPREALDSMTFPTAGKEVIIPAHLRPVVAWLALWDKGVREEVVRVAPEILIGEGDPQGLPVEDRRALLMAYAAEFGQRQRMFRSFARASLRRFASPELTATVNELLGRDSTPPELVIMLLDLLAEGRLAGGVPEALARAMDVELPGRVRQSAIRAVGMAGNDQQRRHLLRLLDRWVGWDQELAGVFVEALFPDHLDAQGVAAVLARVPRQPDNIIPSLQWELEYYLPRRATQEQRIEIATALSTFADPGGDNYQPGVEPDRRLLIHVVDALVAAILDDLGDGTAPISKAVLERLSALRRLQEPEIIPGRFTGTTTDALKRHPPLRRALFWRRVEEYRQEHGRTPTRLWMLRQRPEMDWLGCADETWLVEDAAGRLDIRERLLAFDTLANLPLGTGESQPRDAVLRSLAERDPNLAKRLARMSNRPFEFDPWRAVADRRKRARALREARISAANVRHLRRHLAGIRSGELLNELCFLYRHAERSQTAWTAAATAPLRQIFGDDVAAAARVGWKNFWRRYSPPSPHERPMARATPDEVVIGLTGIAIDVEDGLDVGALARDSAEKATTYAAWEMNGFPGWLKSLASVSPDVVADVLRPSIVQAYHALDGARPHHQMVHRIVGSGPAVRRANSPALRELLAEQDPPSAQTLDEVIRVVLSDPASPVFCDELYEQRCRASAGRPAHFATWWAYWARSSPMRAIEFLEELVEELDQQQAEEVVEQVCVAIHEWRDSSFRDELTARGGPAAIAKLVPIIHHFVRPRDTPQSGMMTPRLVALELRDEIMSWLTDVPGDATVAALRGLAGDAWMSDREDWILHLADERMIANMGTGNVEIAQSLVELYRQYGTKAMGHLAAPARPAAPAKPPAEEPAAEVTAAGPAGESRYMVYSNECPHGRPITEEEYSELNRSEAREKFDLFINGPTMSIWRSGRRCRFELKADERSTGKKLGRKSVGLLADYVKAPERPMSPYKAPTYLGDIEVSPRSAAIRLVAIRRSVRGSQFLVLTESHSEPGEGTYMFQPEGLRYCLIERRTG